MSMTATSAADESAPLAILSPMALFERQCVRNGVAADARALRVMLRTFFDAGMAAGQQNAGASRRPANPDQVAHGAAGIASNSAFAALAEIGFDPARVQANLARSAGVAHKGPGDVDAKLREAVRCLVVVRGRLSTEINYKGVVQAYDAAAAAHGE